MGKLAKALSASAGNAGGDKLYVEDVFSTYLYTGNSNYNSTNQYINNGIALSDEGGLVWLKTRGTLDSHALINTVNGPTKKLSSNSTDVAADVSDYFSFPAAGTTGFNVLKWGFNLVNSTYASYTFRKAEKFFDCVKYSGSSNAAGITVAHNLGSVPAMIIIKNLDNDNRWYVWHKSFANDDYLYLNETFAENNYGAFAYLTANPTSTTVSLVRDGTVNYENQDYVMYLFGDEAAFGDDGDESMVKVGSYTTDGSATAKHIDLGFEPQWVIKKKISSADNWEMYDTMRGWSAPNDTYGVSSAQVFRANLANAEAATTSSPGPTATGMYFPTGGQSTNATYIYMAIRMPMKTPTDGTEVYISDDKLNGNPNFPSPFPVDFALWRSTGGDGWKISSRLMGKRTSYNTTTTPIGDSNARFDYQDGWYGGNEPPPYQSWMFKRAQGFMDVVSHTTALSGTNVQTIKHNLGVAPELIIGKSNTSVDNWYSYSAAIGLDYALYFNTSAARAFYANGAWWGGVAPTNTQFTYSTFYAGNWTYRLFATLAGVSKVGSYTANANSTNIACGFSGTARFILIKRYDAVGDWYLWDSFRGISAAGSNDPYLLLNSANAQVTNTDYIAPYAGGFNLTTNGSSTINVSGGSYIFLAIA